MIVVESSDLRIRKVSSSLLDVLSLTTLLKECLNYRIVINNDAQ